MVAIAVKAKKFQSLIGRFVTVNDKFDVAGTWFQSLIGKFIKNYVVNVANFNTHGKISQ